ncbi:SHOCT domain-containing protein [Sulfurimonas sp.]|uniref:SHOCT domain-containing protein n=1 Tax=Sulfurimonas sp. TaxID=2022749 RepID=UPI002624BAE5|nr:SHOCT domain-containing protein [Sulfurimonas sp.]MCW8894183.1 SHOCT domain-containing protein [Sulfurimonas sp.]MCW9067295.1 SHOCT domain-containing protein [Sulfurimonas sp.]
MKLKIFTLVVLTQIMIGCSATKGVTLTAGAGDVKVDKSKPDNSYEIIGPVSVSNGKGCRDFGWLGSYDGAVTTLQNKVKELNGDYAQITAVTEPHLDGGCFDNRYTILALAYKKMSKEEVLKKSDEENFTKKMRELKALLDEGILSQKEYEGQKAKLLDMGFKQ